VGVCRVLAVGPLVVAVVVGVSLAGAAGAGTDAPDGLVSGRPHIVRFRPELGSVRRQPGKLTPRARATGAAAVASCDPAQVDAAGDVPTTSRADDAATACVVLPLRGSTKRRFLGAAGLTGDGVVDAKVRRKGKRYEIVVDLTSEAAGRDADVWRVDLDGRVVGTVGAVDVGRISPAVVAPASASLVITGPEIHGRAAHEIADAIDQARSEQLVALAREATMTRRARELLGTTAARVEDKAEFVAACPSPETPGTLVLGCYDGRIFVLRVSRPDLAPVMIVTAAHEMLHAAWSAMSSAQKRLIVKQLDDFMSTTGDARIEELLTEYEALQPGTRDNELHSLVGTQVRDLPARLEGYYRRYFTDRSAIVDAFDAYQHVFDDLKAHYDQLDAEVKAIEGELNGLQAELRAAGEEADRLSGQIDALRSEGRIDESNQLVEPQNAAVRRANGLANTYNSRVDGYNAKIAELNELAITLQNTYNEISPVPASG
jgi:hypothetical protein